MAFIDMVSEIHGAVPKIPAPFCKTLINRAWKDTRRQNLWSFLLFEARWVSPPIINVGHVAVTQGSTSVVADATAAAAIIANQASPTILTQRQFRSGIGGIYNIWGFDGTNTLTLDQPYAEATNAAATCSIFQAYYPAPMLDFGTWVSVRDMQNFLDLYTDRYTRAQLDELDPQRTWYYFPTDVVYYTQDQNPNSPTFMFPLFELWGNPQSNFVWQLYGLRKGVDLVNDTDVLPPAVGEDCVLALARKYAYEWAEANKGDNPRNSGPDFRFLMAQAEGDYKRLFKDYRKEDRETVNNFFSVQRSGLYGKYFGIYNSISGTAYPGPML